MFRQPFVFIMLVATIVGGPYIAMETEFGRNVAAKINQMRSGALSGTGNTAWQNRQRDGMNAHHQTENLWDRVAEHPHHNHEWIATENTKVVGGPFHDFRDVLRFDATPFWVTSQFSRVTTVVADPRLQGLRVPVVTGPRRDDMAGTITFYFTDKDQLQRLTFNGFTGDPTRLISLMLEHYHFSPDHSLGPGGYSYKWYDKPSSVMKVTPTPVIYATSPNSQYTVFLEINQPRGDYGISYAASNVVRTAKGSSSQQWPPTQG